MTQKPGVNRVFAFLVVQHSFQESYPERSNEPSTRSEFRVIVVLIID